MPDVAGVITRVWRHRGKFGDLDRSGRIDYEAVKADGERVRLWAATSDGLYPVLLTYLETEPPANPEQELLQFDP